MKLWLTLGLLAILCVPARAADREDIKRAIEKGVKALRSFQQADGTWPRQQIGATALGGLTLLECGAKEDDKDVLRAANAVRKASIPLTSTYSISLAIIFLDRLGDPDDVPLIESLVVRLLAGQDASSGGWSYSCPAISAAEIARLQSKLNQRKEGEGRRDSAKPGTKRKREDLAPEIREQLTQLRQPGAGRPGFPPIPGGGGAPMLMGGDNSNTQFATLALWVGRRHGLPIDRALTRLNKRFRDTQMEDGGWTYMPMFRPQGPTPNMPLIPGLGSSAAMTCAGLLALAIVDGATLDYARKRKPDAKLPDISADKELGKGLQALGAVIDNPRGIRANRGGAAFAPPGAPMPPAERVGGNTYYFLWSLERVAVALDLQTIGKKDWYGWGAEILLENQQADGSWFGNYGGSGVDTCFALLFLRRANLLGDLTASLKGKVADPGERVLRAGGGGKQRWRKGMTSGIERKEAKPIQKPLLKAPSSESGKLAEALLKEKGPRRDELLEKLENEKGPMYTDALAAAIPLLEGEDRRKARQALANRLTRMKDGTLQEYLRDEDAEIRRAAAIAVGQKDSKELVPHLIALLSDPEASVVRAAHASLKALTGQDFGPDSKATREERDQAVLKWIAWWSKQRKK